MTPHPMTPVLKDFERYKKWHREAHDRLLTAMDLNETFVPYHEPVHCRHFEGGTEDCGYSCSMVFGDRFLQVKP